MAKSDTVLHWEEGDKVRMYRLQTVTGACYRSVSIGQGGGNFVSVVVQEAEYADHRRQIAQAYDLIVPEDASRPEHILATLGIGAKKETAAVGAAAR